MYAFFCIGLNSVLCALNGFVFHIWGLSSASAIHCFKVNLPQNETYDRKNMSENCAFMSLILNNKDVQNNFFYRCTVHSDIYTVHAPTDAHLLKL